MKGRRLRLASRNKCAPEQLREKKTYWSSKRTNTSQNVVIIYAQTLPNGFGWEGWGHLNTSTYHNTEPQNHTHSHKNITVDNIKQPLCLFCPTGHFSWDKYLKETGASAAPAHCFRQVSPPNQTTVYPPHQNLMSRHATTLCEPSAPEIILSHSTNHGIYRVCKNYDQQAIWDIG
jgi:hypothetical protein